MNLDRDLRDALQPLRGDPIADAQRVLGALGDVGPGSGREPGRSPKTLPIAALLAGVLAIGVVLGVAIAKFYGDTAPVEVTPPKDEQPKDEQPRGEQPKDEQPKPAPEPQGLMLMAFGTVDISEPKKVREALKPGGYMVASGTLFETTDGMAGVYVYRHNVAVRLARQSIAAIEDDRVLLRTGLLWLSTLGQTVPLRIDAEVANVLLDDAELMVDRRDNGVVITVLGGTATIRSSGGESRRITAMQRCEIDAAGMLGSTETVPFAGSVTGWMAPMILQQTDENELYARIEEMVEAYVEGTHRDAAVRELRRLGARSVPKLFETLDVVIADPELVHRTAQLVGDLADDPRREWLLAMLERGDEVTRTIAFRAIVRVTGTTVRDEGFWRTGTAPEREVEALRWREILR